MRWRGLWALWALLAAACGADDLPGLQWLPPNSCADSVLRAAWRNAATVGDGSAALACLQALDSDARPGAAAAACEVATELFVAARAPAQRRFAIELLQAAATAWPRPHFLQQLAAMMQQAGDPDHARRVVGVMRELVAFNGSHAQYRGGLGAVLESNMRFGEAMEQYRLEVQLLLPRNDSLHACAHAWALQDDLLAEPSARLLASRVTAAPPATTSTRFLPDQLARLPAAGRARLLSNASVHAASGTAEWAWYERDAVVLRLDNARLLYGRTAMLVKGCVLFSRGNEPMEDWRTQANLFPRPGGDLWGMDAAQQSFHSHVRVVDWPAALLVNAFSWNNHFHWIVDVLARLVVFAEDVQPRVPGVRALLPLWAHGDSDDLEARLRESADLLGLPHGSIMGLWPEEQGLHLREAYSIEWRRPGPVECRGLIDAAPSQRQPQCFRQWPKDLHMNSVYMPPCEVLRALRLRAWRRVHGPDEPLRPVDWTRRPLRVLLAPRGPDTELRAVHGEDELLSELRAALAPVGAVVEVFDPRNRTLTQQAAEMQGVDVLLGAHGAALANVAFMRPGAALVELPTTEHPASRYFQDMSTALDVAHWLVPTAGAEKRASFELGAAERADIIEAVVVAVLSL